MSVPFYATENQICEYCESTICIGHETVVDNDGFFCNKECWSNHQFEVQSPMLAYLTDDPMHRSVD